MSKIVKYSKLNSKFKVSNRFKKTDNILLDELTFHLNDFNYELNEKNIIISKNLDEFDIRITGTKAKNIYFEGFDNLGDITIPFSFSGRLYISFKDRSKIKKLNILNETNTTIDLEDNIKNITIIKEINLVFIVEYKNKSIEYVVDKAGKVLEIKRGYIITQNDIQDNSLILCKLSDYKYFKFDNLTIDTLIINKELLSDIEKLKCFNKELNYVPFHNRVLYKRLRIIDDNEMKLNPFDITFDNGNYWNTNFVKGEKNFILIKEKNNNVLIYIDKNNDIKVLSEKDIKKDNNVRKVYFVDNSFRANNNLIIIKYNNYYKVIDFDIEYIIEPLFFILLSKNTKKYNSGFYEMLRNYDLIGLFEKYNITKNDFFDMCAEYIVYKTYLEDLKKLGFSNSAIKYLFDKKMNSLIEPNKDNLNDISETEIKCFNEIGDYYVKKKRLEKFKGGNTYESK